MKDKILLFIIFGLLISIIIINTNYLKDLFKDRKIINPEVKSAVINNDDYSFIRNSKKVPIKINNFYEPENIWANSFILYDINSGTILAQENANTRMPVASTTKVMTAIIVFENYQMNDVITISQKAQEQIGSYLGFEIDEKISVDQLLYILLLKSSNEAAYAFAEHIGFDNFVSKMNEKAKYLSIYDTNFRDPAGLDDSGYSTAHDMAVITAYALKNPKFSQITKISKYTAQSIDGTIKHELENSNRLVVPEEQLFYSETIAGKTGYTPDAGHCLVSAATKNNHTLISVIIKTDEDVVDASAKETKKLFEWGFENYKWN